MIPANDRFGIAQYSRRRVAGIGLVILNMNRREMGGGERNGSTMASQLRRSILVTCLALVACATATTPTKGRNDLLSFLNDGITRRDEVRVKLGEPSAEFERSRIAAYRLGRDEAGFFVVERRESWSESWSGVRYNLMLVFDGDGNAVLCRHALVEVRSP